MKPDNPYAAMIAGTHSGSGKTTWTLALLELARRKGLTAQPFKAGPDYIDPGFHSAVASPRISRNLDLFLLSAETVQKSFQRHAADADLSLVEGMMGLFDGREIDGCSTSSAQVAKTLGLPVFLVIDGAGLATSAAAIVLGFQQFDPDVRLAGVLFNRVSSASHFDWLKLAVESRTGVPFLGYLPKDEELHIPERHLGLMTAAEFGGNSSGIRSAADKLETQFDWDRFLKAAQANIPKAFQTPEERKPESVSLGRSLRIGVARDRAFSFYYEDNLDALREAGAELAFFSPLEDARLSAGLDLLYFGGGFPELYAVRLSQNQTMLEAVKAFYRSGGFIYAECGGLIYLSETFVGEDRRAVPLVWFSRFAPQKSRERKYELSLDGSAFFNGPAAAGTQRYSGGRSRKIHAFFSAGGRVDRPCLVGALSGRAKDFAGRVARFDAVGGAGFSKWRFAHGRLCGFLRRVLFRQRP